VQQVIAHQPIHARKHFLVCGQLIDKHKPCRSTLAIFEILQEAAIQCSGHPARDRGLVELKHPRQFRLANFRTAAVNQTGRCLEDLAHFQFDGRVDSFRHQIRDQRAHRFVVIQEGNDATALVPGRVAWCSSAWARISIRTALKSRRSRAASGGTICRQRTL
jgi:hypothetical protein